MKPHIIIKLHTELQNYSVPFWIDFINNKSVALTMLHPSIDRLMSNRHIAFWVTSEYPSAGATWSAPEVAAGFNRIYRIILRDETSIPENLIQQISLLPIVEDVRPGIIVTSPISPSRLSIASSAADEVSRQSIYLKEAHDYTRGDESITIAVLDTGINLSHPELSHTLLKGYDFVDIIDGAGKFIGDFLGYDEMPEDEVGHGTHVAGIIAASGRSMPKGIVPQCKILPVRVLGAMNQGERKVGAGLIDNINTAIKWAVDQGVDVINMSLGIKHTEGGLPHEEVVNYARKKGVTIVAASGNDGSEEYYYPGALPHVIAVGAADERGEVAHFSTYGRQVSFIAPGTDIYSSYLNNDYAFSTGTSHAAPFVTGAVAMLKSYGKRKGVKVTDKQVKFIMKHTADKVDTRFKNLKAGFGKINLLDSLKLLKYKLEN